VDVLNPWATRFEIVDAGSVIEETLAFVAGSLREIKKRILRCSGQELVANAGYVFLKVFLELATQDPPVGGARSISSAIPPLPQQRSWSPGLDAESCSISSGDYVIEHGADDDAVLVTTRPVSQAWQGVWRMARQYTVRCVQDHVTARSAFCRGLTFRATVMRSSTAARYLPKDGPTIQIVWKPHTCPPTPDLRPTKLATDDRNRQAAAVLLLGCWRYGLGVGDIEQQLRLPAKCLCGSESAASHVSMLGASVDRRRLGAYTPRTRRASTEAPVIMIRDQRTAAALLCAISEWPIWKSKNQTM